MSGLCATGRPGPSRTGISKEEHSPRVLSNVGFSVKLPLNCEPRVKAFASLWIKLFPHWPLYVMSEVTAEMIARGRFNDARSPERRRLSDRVREARERLTSAGAGNIVFDLE